jgi:hypothetical protein
MFRTKHQDTPEPTTRATRPALDPPSQIDHIAGLGVSPSVQTLSP